MAKKENGNATKSFILRVDAEMMEAIEVQTARCNTFWIKPYARLGASKRNEY